MAFEFFNSGGYPTTRAERVNYSQIIRKAHKFYENDRLDKAKELYEKAVEIYPNKAEAFFFIGNTCLKCDDYQGAIDKLLMANDKKPDDFRTLFNLGFAYWKNGNNELARRYIRAAIAINPDIKDMLPPRIQDLIAPIISVSRP